MRLLLAVFLLCNLSVAQQSVRTVFLGPACGKSPPARLIRGSPQRVSSEAECLSNTLKDAGIKNIYVSEAKRTQQTADPLAKRLKLKPTVMKAEDSANLVRNLLYAGNGNTLVVGHGDTLPVIVARMKAGTVAPIGENEYDRLLVMTTIEGSATPMVTLHYCEASGPAAAPAATAKPAATKKPVRKH